MFNIPLQAFFYCLKNGANYNKRCFSVPSLSLELFVRVIGLEPTRLAAPDPKSGMSTNFTIPATIGVQI